MGALSMRERHPGDDDVWEGLRLTGVAVSAAVIVAALVIAAGDALLPRVLETPEPAPAILAVVMR